MTKTQSVAEARQWMKDYHEWLNISVCSIEARTDQAISDAVRALRHQGFTNIPEVQA